LEFTMIRNDVLMVRIDRRRKFPATTFLRAIGVSDDAEIRKLFADVDTAKDHQYIDATIKKDLTTSQVEATLELYKKLRPGEPIVLDNAQELLRTMFFDYRRYSLERVGRYKMNKKLGVTVSTDREHWVLTKEDIIESLRYLIGLASGKGDVDDIDQEDESGWGGSDRAYTVTTGQRPTHHRRGQ
ncbi:MAG: DNA-directed RNA polymerase subunit beta, partial [Microgenomates group bacterium GW2011_GWA2_47_8]